MRVDEEREALVNLVGVAEKEFEEAKWNLFLYDNRRKISEYHLGSTKLFLLGANAKGHCLVSKSPLSNCPMDDSHLVRVSAVCGGHNVCDSALYRCEKCDVIYFVPLSSEELSRRRENSSRYGGVVV